MHDISMFVCDHTIHGQVSAEVAEQYLTDRGFSNDFIHSVAQAIAEHGVDFDTLTPEEMGTRFSLAGKILIEADLLDKFGASAGNQRLACVRKKRLTSIGMSAGIDRKYPAAKGKILQRVYLVGDWKEMRDNRFGFFVAFLEQLSQKLLKLRNQARRGFEYAAQHSVRPTGGSLRVFRQFS